ncbi:MAG: hypothetical protein HOP12_01815 [Candidatus Eisenbacteria bacterium]|uniref:Uncharacterized protein n=1 Tax=Eiseniibacteriota bacterium TaxID=2212470 RepID=A0A849SEN2_UNCEI|nr:hypothetical protein [Candidatus Eisenbacteria bacterium]
MKRLHAAALFTLGLLAGCMASSPPSPPAPSGSAALPPESPLGSPFAQAAGTAGGRCAPLLIDRTDLRIGTTVHFDRIPSRTELYELHQVMGLAHVVVTLPEWPDDYANVASIEGLPPESDLIVVLPGYPASRAQAEQWNFARNVQLRIVVLVKAPPASSVTLEDLNQMRALERVICEMDQPSRSGFERLQRPLSFRKVIE